MASTKPKNMGEAIDNYGVNTFGKASKIVDHGVEMVGKAVTRDEKRTAADLQVLQDEVTRLRERERERREARREEEEARLANLEEENLRYRQAEANRQSRRMVFWMVVVGIVVVALIVAVIYLIAISPAPATNPVAPTSVSSPLPPAAQNVDAYGFPFNPARTADCIPLVGYPPVAAGLACCNRIPDPGEANACRAKVGALAR
ncbi:MAG: hypothetical protein PHD72_01320 [Patescibacteria group bacterium]|nr:hypothetical protein [Patescibacteria group bacterium]